MDQSRLQIDILQVNYFAAIIGDRAPDNLSNTHFYGEMRAPSIRMQWRITLR
jgi:hypothetical protein